MVILAVTVLLAGPRFVGAISTMEIQAASRDVASALRAARSDALRGRTDVSLTMDVDDREYSLSTSEEVHSFASDIDVRMVTGSADIFSDRQGAITFFPDGSSTGGRITLSRGGQVYDVDVNWLTGRVRILDD